MTAKSPGEEGDGMLTENQLSYSYRCATQLLTKNYLPFRLLLAHMNTDTQPALNIYDDDLRISAFTYEVSRL